MTFMTKIISDIELKGEETIRLTVRMSVSSEDLLQISCKRFTRLTLSDPDLPGVRYSNGEPEILIILEPS